MGGRLGWWSILSTFGAGSATAGLKVILLMKRRDLFKLFLAVPGCAAASAWKGKAALGANTAISGMGFFEAVSLLHELRFPVIEIQGMGILPPTPGKFPGFNFDKLTAGEKRSIRDALGGFEHATIHLPYDGLAYFNSSPAQAAASLDRVKYALDAAGFFGCETAVVHTTNPVGMTSAEAWPHMVSRFREWGDFARAHKFRLAAETGTGGIVSAREFVRFIKEIDHPNVGCTLDVGHEIHYREFEGRIPAAERSTPAGIRAYNDLIQELVDTLGPKLIHFHVHDIDPAIWKDHVPVGTGVIDYPRFVSRLRETNYQGYFILEIAAPNMRSSLLDSKRRMEGFLEA